MAQWDDAKYQFLLEAELTDLIEVLVRDSAESLPADQIKRATLAVLLQRKIEERDYAGLFSMGQATDDFTGPAFAAGWTWAGAPFAIPASVTFPGRKLAVADAGAIRAFLYRSISATPDQFTRLAIYTSHVGDYIGLRMDDGTDNNYIEADLRYQAANNFDFVKIYRTGGGAVTTTSMVTLGAYPLWCIPALGIVGTKWTNWSGNPRLMINGPGTIAPGSIGSGLTWTPTRMGIVFQTGTAAWQILYADWYRQT